MTTHPRSIGEERIRKRTAHKKSKRGCGNCKLRRVKCDENRPKCLKCTSFGVSCNYDPETSDLQMSFDGTATLESSQKPPCLTKQTPLRITEVPVCLYPAIVADDKSTFQLDSQSLDRVCRFQTLTVLSIGTKRAARHFQDVMTSLAFSSPYVMHVVQTITAIHDRHISASSNPRHTSIELYHLSQAVTLFNRKLSEPIQASDRDALWTTAALLAAVTFSSIEASKPEEAWPLKPPDPSDLEWLRMCKMKTAVWNITNPLRPDGVFHVLADHYEKLYLGSAASRARCGLEGIPSVFIQLFGLSNLSTANNNPYYAAVRAFSPLLCMEWDESNTSAFLSFISHIRPEFRRLLEIKDPHALLLLAYWYAKVCNSIWWIERRAILECQAICLYLEKYHAGERLILELLQFPKTRCGLEI